MKKKTLFILVKLLIIFGIGCGSKHFLYKPAPGMLPNVEPDMKTVGYWLTKHPYPDKVILNEKEIESLNADIVKNTGIVTDISEVSPYFSKKQLYYDLKSSLKNVSDEKLFFKNGQKVNKYFYEDVKKNMRMNDLFYDGIYVFAFVYKLADQRILPTEEGLFEDPRNLDIDKLQNSALDIGTPLAIMHETSDRKWYYARSPYSTGWVEADKIIICERDAIAKYCDKTPFLVVTKAKGELFSDDKLREYYGYVRMGTKLPLFSELKSGVCKVLVPFPTKEGALSFGIVYISEDDVSKGYLPYTPGTIIKQAFEFLNAPYGWGGMYGEQDCSKFIQQLFLTVGITLPRNSGSQSQVGKLISELDRKVSETERVRILTKDAVAGITILPIEGHIMLYLGVVDGEPYAIHEIWGYAEDGFVHLIKRVVVSDLNLGRRSAKGSFLERITSVREISK
ncbi:MAG: SH3 domain-containing protein [Endomicrobiales bacterium]|nr:SH3 domain-containing protein [Endomicrobiales bacterium]